jgi:hypothetical protein
MLVAILAMPSPALALCKRGWDAGCSVLAATHQKGTQRTVSTSGDSRCFFPVTVPAVGEALVARDSHVLPVLQARVANLEGTPLVPYSVNDGTTAPLAASVSSQSLLCVFLI